MSHTWLIFLAIVCLSSFPVKAQIVLYLPYKEPIDQRFDTMKVVEKALKLYRNGKYKQSISMWNEAIKKYPQEIALYDFRAITKSNIGEKKSALSDLQTSIGMTQKESSDYIPRLLMFASFNSEAKNFQEAISTYNELVKIENLDKSYLGEVYLGRGQAKAMLKDYKAAIEDYQKYFEANVSQPIELVSIELFAWANWFDYRYIATIQACDSLLTPQAMNELGEYVVNVTRAIRGLSKYYQKDYEGCILDLSKLLDDTLIVLSGNDNKQVEFATVQECKRCLAHSYLFVNNYAKAEKIYKSEIKKSPAFAATLRTDLQKFKENGVTHPDLAKVEALLPTK